MTGRRSAVTRLSSMFLAALLVAGSLAPAGGAEHAIPEVLDEVTIEDHGGYGAWRIQVDPVDGDWGTLYLHLGHHTYTNATTTGYTHVGVWFVNLDHGYVWNAIASTIEMDGAYAHAEVRQPAPLETSVATPQDQWSAQNGGELSLPSGEWLVVAFLISDGTLEAPTTIGSGIADGEPSIQLVNATSGDQHDVFAFEDGDFGGSVNTYVAADAEDSCLFCVAGGTNARVIRDGHAQTRVDDRLFGLFSSPGSVSNDVGWSSSTESGTDSSRYWFHGASPDVYDFWVHENIDVQTQREPVAAFGADVRIPTP